MLARGSPTPLYRQFKSKLVKEIETGARVAHSQLPSEREWVTKLGVSRITVRQALNELVQQGYLYSVPGKGFFVGEPPGARMLDAFLSFTAAAQQRGEKATSRVLAARLMSASAEVARSLHVDPGTEVVFLSRLRLSNDVPMMIQESYLPHALVPGLLSRDLDCISVYATLHEDYRLQLSRGETTISARPAQKKESSLLDLKPPAVVLVADQTTFAVSGQCVERSVHVMHPVRHPLFLVQHAQPQRSSPAAKSK